MHRSEVLTAAEMARSLGITKRAVNLALRRAKVAPVMSVGGVYLYDLTTLTLLQQRKSPGRPKGS